MPSPEPASNATIRRHVDSGTLEVRASDDDEVAAFWRKALVAYADARLARSSLEARLLRAYDAGRIAAFAIVRSAGYRTRGGEGHHYATFDVARSLVDDSDLRHALDEMSGIRTLRHAVEYEPEEEIDPKSVATAVEVAARIINGGARQLREAHPAAKARIGKVRSLSAPAADGEGEARF